MQSLENDLRNLLRELRILKTTSVSELQNDPWSMVYLLLKGHNLGPINVDERFGHFWQFLLLTFKICHQH